MKIVLVVKDYPGHAKLIRKALCQSQGTMVTVAETAGTALEALGVHLASPEDLVRPDLILLDLGLSLHQLEGSGRGFSFKRHEPLDMRMDPRNPVTAEELVNDSVNAVADKVKEQVVNDGDPLTAVVPVGALTEAPADPDNMTPTLDVLTEILEGRDNEVISPDTVLAL